MDEKDELVRRNKRNFKQCNESKEDNTIKYIDKDKENDAYMKSYLDFISNLKTFLSKKMLHMISIFLKLPRFVLCPSM